MRGIMDKEQFTEEIEETILEALDEKVAELLGENRLRDATDGKGWQDVDIPAIKRFVAAHCESLWARHGEVIRDANESPFFWVTPDEWLQTPKHIFTEIAKEIG